MQRLELAWFEQRRTGSLMAVLNEDVNQMERFLNGGANDLIQVFAGSLLVGARVLRADRDAGGAGAPAGAADPVSARSGSSAAGPALHGRRARRPARWSRA